MKIVTLVRKVIRFELGLWKSLCRWIFRRPVQTDPTGLVFSYANVVTPVIIGITVVSMIEIPVAHLLLPWQPVRVVLLILGVQTVFWMVGYLASLWMNPHVVSDSGLRVRYGTGIDFTIAWRDIAAVRTRMRSVQRNRTVVYEETDSGHVLSLSVSNQTNLDIVLRKPVTVMLRGEPSEAFCELRFFADDSSALATAARRNLTPQSGMPAGEPDAWGPAGASLGELR